MKIMQQTYQVVVRGVCSVPLVGTVDFLEESIYQFFKMKQELEVIQVFNTQRGSERSYGSRV
jgi:hypothetical protein